MSFETTGRRVGVRKVVRDVRWALRRRREGVRVGVREKEGREEEWVVLLSR